jgi:flagellar basal-body rod protein FlgC
MADNEGFIYKAPVDVEEEYVDMLEASRQYQNNVEVISTIKALMLKTANMGK